MQQVYRITALDDKKKWKISRVQSWPVTEGSSNIWENPWRLQRPSKKMKGRALLNLQEIDCSTWRGSEPFIEYSQQFQGIIWSNSKPRGTWKPCTIQFKLISNNFVPSFLKGEIFVGVSPDHAITCISKRTNKDQGNTPFNIQRTWS